MKKIILTIALLIGFLSINAQSFNDLNCLGLHFNQVKVKMTQNQIGRTNIGSSSKAVILVYSDLKYGSIYVYFDKNNICFKQAFVANYSLSHLIDNEYSFVNCNKKVVYEKNYFIIEFIKKG